MLLVSFVGLLVLSAAAATTCFDNASRPLEIIGGPLRTSAVEIRCRLFFPRDRIEDADRESTDSPRSCWEWQAPVSHQGEAIQRQTLCAKAEEEVDMQVVQSAM